MKIFAIHIAHIFCSKESFNFWKNKSIFFSTFIHSISISNPKTISLIALVASVSLAVLTYFFYLLRKPKPASAGKIQDLAETVSKTTDAPKKLEKRLDGTLLENQILQTAVNQYLLYSVTDTEGNILDANPNFCHTSGYTYDELIGKNYRILNSGTHSEEFWQHLWIQLSKGNTWRGEICNRMKSGELRWFETVITPFINEDKFTSLQRDITDNKQVENERDQLGLLIDNVLNGAYEVSIIGTDDQGLITLFNRGAEMMLGYSAAEIVGKTSPMVFHLNEEITARSLELSNQYKAPLEGFRVFIHYSELQDSEARNWTYVRKDGSHLQVSLAVTAMRDSNGKISGYLIVGTDVTEEIQIRRELKSTIGQFSIATDVAELGVWSWNLLDDSLDWNDRMFDIYNLPRGLWKKGLKFSHWIDSIHLDDAETIKSSINHFIVEGGTYDAVLRLLDTDGKVHHIQVRAQIENDENGTPLKVIGVNRDITTQQELENWLREAKENADAASAAKTAFLANISHEIRTPMTAILGMLELLQRTDLTIRQKDYLAKTFTATKSLLWLINETLDFSKIESGKLELDYHNFEIESLLRDIAIILYENKSEKRAELIFDLDPLVPKTLVGDRLRLQQVLINLISNSLKFTKEGKVIVEVKLKKKKEGHALIGISVSDTGIGISKENIARIFDSFVQAENSITRRFGGTGLGLTISKRLVDLMGGNLQVESSIGIGSRFWFDITLKYTEKEILPPDELSSLLNGFRILVVDDNDACREVIKKLTSDFGAYVNEADSALNAINKINHAIDNDQLYDIILLDAQMPDMDGSIAVKLINDISQKKPPIILLLTTLDQEENLIQRLGPTRAQVNFLTKPITPQQLVDAIKNYLSPDNIQQTNPTKAYQRPLAGIRLLVVDDNAINRHVASELLESEGAIVDTAEGGLEGVKKVLESDLFFDLVLMDVQMPNVDGLEATRRIRANNSFESLPIIAMTANVSKEDVQHCISAGMDDHIGKPIDINELTSAVLKLLNKSGIQNTKPNTDNLSYASDALVEDIEKILQRFGGNLVLYARLLPSFYDEIAKLLATIDQENQKSDFTSVAFSLHSLKSIAGTAGAIALANQALACEKKIALSIDNSEVSSIIQNAVLTMKELFYESFNLLKLSLENSSHTVFTPSEPEPLLTQEEWEIELGNIARLLELGDLSATGRLESLFNRSGPSERYQLSEALELAVKMNFNLAQASITQILAERSK